MQRALLVLAALLALAPGLRAQSTSSVTAQLSTGIVKLGQEARLSIVAENVKQAKVEALPEVDGLRLGPLKGPSESIMQTISNGRVSTSRTLTWVASVQPLRKGDFRIPAITVEADGEKKTTRELALKAVEDLQGEDLGWFEIDAPDQVAEGQPFTLELRFGWDAALDSRLNYANLSLPWMDTLAGVVELETPPKPPNVSTLELNLNSRDRVVTERLPDREQNGRTFHLLRLRKRYLATRAGKLEIPISHLEFGAVDQSGGIFGLRPTREKETYYKRFPGFTIDVIQLPEKDRPFDFSGAVGKLQASASADRRDVDVGESIKLTVEWTGDANLEFFEPPDLGRDPAFQGLRVYGTNDKKAYERRSVVYDLAPITTEVKEIPPVRLRVYDPTQKAYVQIATAPIPIQVRALKNAVSLGSEDAHPGAALDIRDIQPRVVDGEPGTGPRGWLPWAALGAVLSGWMWLRGFVRKSGDPDAPRARARRAAQRQLMRELPAARSASAQMRALERFLAARSGENPGAWLGRDVSAWAAESPGRLSAECVTALAQLFARLDERTWAGSDQALDPAEISAVAQHVSKAGL